MAVLLWGGAAVVGTIVFHDEHSDYSNHHDYSNWGEYSDYAERQRRRLASLQSDTESAARELSGYKSYTVNPELGNQHLKQTSAMRVSTTDMDSSAKAKIQRRIESDEVSETSSLKSELELVDDILDKISRIEKEN
ncbi:MAG: hypothetical protein IJP54_07195 [Synergistaceae bacterium]|nr:hypothetical protein [Synergistaceae bacterium]MBR0035446.1 hypothetical protein [Synergistaceae bacterium]